MVDAGLRISGAMPVSDPISRVGRQALMRKPKSIQGATKMPINQCDRLRTLACFFAMAGGGMDANTITHQAYF